MQPSNAVEQQPVSANGSPSAAVSSSIVRGAAKRGQRPFSAAGIAAGQSQSPQQTGAPPTPGSNQAPTTAATAPALQQQQQQQHQEGAKVPNPAKQQPAGLKLQDDPHQQQQQQQEGGADADEVIREPPTPQEPEHCHLQQEGSYDDAASSPGGSLEAANKGSRAPSPDAATVTNLSPTPSLSSARRTAVAVKFEHTPQLDASAAAAAVAAQQRYQQLAYASFEQLYAQPAASGQQARQHGGSAIPPGVVGTFFPVVSLQGGPLGGVEWALGVGEGCRRSLAAALLSCPASPPGSSP